MAKTSDKLDNIDIEFTYDDAGPKKNIVSITNDGFNAFVVFERKHSDDQFSIPLEKFEDVIEFFEGAKEEYPELLEHANYRCNE
jgi:hypothetical protein